MAYLEFTLEAYDNLIKAAGNRGAQVAKVCREQGSWEDAAATENPAHDERQTELDVGLEPAPEPDAGPAADAAATAVADPNISDR